MTNVCLPVHSTAFQTHLPLDFNIRIDSSSLSIVNTIQSVVEKAALFRYIDSSNRNRYGYDSIKMLECVLLAFSVEGYASVRKLSSLCKTDIRFIYIMQGQTPSFMAFERFLHDDLNDKAEEIFYQMNRYIEDNDDNLDTNVMTIDGTKYEANANKMTFVWMKATRKRKAKLWGQVFETLKNLNYYLREQEIDVQFSILHTMTIDYLNDVCSRLEKIAEEKKIEFVHGKGKRKTELQRYYDKLSDASIRMWKYQIHEDIAGKRNSFSKTDPDSTMMHMKYDYYNHTNVFKPGYNIQLGVSDGYIRNIYISADPNDINTYIPFMDKYYRAYGKYPKKTPADAGYGSYDNYSYCESHGIELWLKYAGQEKQKKATDKDRFKTWSFKKDEEGNLLCPQGHAFKTVSVRTEMRGKYPRIIETQMTGKCEGCPLRLQCTKAKNGRKISRTRQLEKYQKKVRENMSTEEGKKLMELRSVQSEGMFGNLKSNWEYDKLHRRGNSGVNLELLLVCMGENLRHYHRRIILNGNKTENMKS